MGLRIVNNINAMNARTNLVHNTAKVASSIERISSGLKINRGADGIGLQKSESLLSQVRGIAKAQLNISNGQSVVGVAEGSLAQLTDITQRLRDVVVQASDATISSGDRDNIQNSVRDLLNEYARVASASEFDGIKLLDGSFSSRTIQVGPNTNDQISLSFADARASAIGRIAVLTAQSTNEDSGGTGSTTVSLGDINVTFNGLSFNTSNLSDDHVSNREGNLSSIAVKNGLDAFGCGVTAIVLPNVVTWNYTAAFADNITNSMSLSLNGVNIAQANYAADDTGAQSFVDAINNIQTRTGVVASVNTSTNYITLTAADGRNIDMGFAGMDTGDNNYLMGFRSFSSVATGSFIQSGSIKLVSDSPFILEDLVHGGTTYTGYDSTTTLNNLDVSTADNAAEGINILDNTIRQLQERRALAGSKAIRLNLAESELLNRQENLSAATSTIRDADIAAETAQLTTAQILQQSASVVLTKSNTIPQLALLLMKDINA